MIARLPIHDEAASPPPERGRSARAASRVGVNLASRFNRTVPKTTRARQLRRDLTNVEMRLWQRLRNKQLGADFRRQHPAGRFILDFYCSALQLATELDGGQHAQATAMARDSVRTRWLEERGVVMLRFWNSDVMQNLPGVLEVIAVKIAELQRSKLTPTRRWRADLPLSGGGQEPKGRI